MHTLSNLHACYIRDPLSPFIFTLVVDGFSALISRATDSGLIKGFKSSRLGLSVSHLQFANVIICFVEACSNQVANLKLISKKKNLMYLGA